MVEPTIAIDEDEVAIFMSETKHSIAIDEDEVNYILAEGLATTFSWLIDPSNDKIADADGNNILTVT